jgi:hypothetical protein
MKKIVRLRGYYTTSARIIDQRGERPQVLFHDVIKKEEKFEETRSGHLRQSSVSSANLYLFLSNHLSIPICCPFSQTHSLFACDDVNWNLILHKGRRECFYPCLVDALMTGRDESPITVHHVVYHHVCISGLTHNEWTVSPASASFRISDHNTSWDIVYHNLLFISIFFFFS